MDSMMKSTENMVTPTLGSIVLKSLTTYPLVPSLMVRFSAFMVVSAPKSRLSIRSEPSTEELRCLMKDLSAI